VLIGGKSNPDALQLAFNSQTPTRRSVMLGGRVIAECYDLGEPGGLASWSVRSFAPLHLSSLTLEPEESLPFWRRGKQYILQIESRQDAMRLVLPQIAYDSVGHLKVESWSGTLKLKVPAWGSLLTLVYIPRPYRLERDGQRVGEARAVKKWAEYQASVLGESAEVNAILLASLLLDYTIMRND